MVGLSVAAAFLLASSAVLQQRAAAHSDHARAAARARAVPGPGLLLELVRDPLWLAGWVTNVSGFLLQAAALYLGSVSVVQPLIVTQLLFALPLGLLGSGRRMPTGAWWAAGSVCTGLVVLLVVRGDPGADSPLDSGRLVVALVAGTALAAVLVTASAGRHAAVRAGMLGVAAGCFFALSAVLMKRTAQLLVDDGIAATASSWYGYALAGATLCSLLLGQGAFASGPFSAAVTGMNITNPVVSYVLAMLVYGVPAPTDAGQLAGLVIAAVLVVVGVAGLARVLPPARAT